MPKARFWGKLHHPLGQFHSACLKTVKTLLDVLYSMASQAKKPKRLRALCWPISLQIIQETIAAIPRRCYRFHIQIRWSTFRCWFICVTKTIGTHGQNYTKTLNKAHHSRPTAAGMPTAVRLSPVCFALANINHQSCQDEKCTVQMKTHPRFFFYF